MVEITGKAFFESVRAESLIMFLLLIILTVFLVNLVSGLLSRHLKRFVGAPYHKLLPKLVTYPLYFVSLYFGFDNILNFDIPSFLTAFGILGIAVAFSAQQTLQNMIAGIILAIERPFNIGDTIDYAGNVCMVRDIFLRTTLLRALDGKIIYAPNSAFITGNVVNYSKGEFIRVQVPMFFPTGSDVKKIEEIIQKECHDHPDVLPHLHRRKETFLERLLDEPIDMKHLEPRVFVKAIDRDKIIIETRFWVEDVRKREEILSVLLVHLMEKFRDEGIKYG